MLVFFITRVQKLADILWGDSLLKYGVIAVAGTIVLKIMAVYMEATILIPLIAQLYLFYENQRQKGEEAVLEKNFILKFGFLSSLVILARIDAGLLILFLSYHTFIYASRSLHLNSYFFLMS